MVGSASARPAHLAARFSAAGSRPFATANNWSRANSRASASSTAGKRPSVTLAVLPLARNRTAQDFAPLGWITR